MQHRCKTSPTGHGPEDMRIRHADSTHGEMPQERHSHDQTGEVIEFYHAELEALKEQIAKEMGYELVDHRLELFGRKLPDNKS